VDWKSGFAARLAPDGVLIFFVGFFEIFFALFFVGIRK
jgi:hypothetical protein